MTITLAPRSFQYWSTAQHAWVTNLGQRTVFVGGSSAALRLAATTATAEVGGTVPATLSLTLTGPASFGAVPAGRGQDLHRQPSANVISTAGNATLSAGDPGHLSNGAFTLSEPLQVAFSKSTWSAPVSNDPVTIAFSQHIGRTEPLRTGTYSRTVTFTLSTTEP